MFNTIHIGETAGMLLAWPTDKVIMHKQDQIDNTSKTNSTEPSCMLCDWIGGEVVAKGHLYSSNPN